MQNLQQELEEIIKTKNGNSLLIHSCCAPCSSHVLDYLVTHFKITLLFYNPNILPEDEYLRRLNEQKRLLKEMPSLKDVNIIEGSYDPKLFLALAKGLEDQPEGGKRCELCYELRLREAAVTAKELDCDYFTTTLSVSPHKSSQKLDAIALSLEAEYGVKRLPSDFKKKGGYQRSIALSKEYNLYRQDWCGCPFSKEQANNRKED